MGLFKCPPDLIREIASDLEIFLVLNYPISLPVLFDGFSGLANFISMSKN